MSPLNQPIGSENPFGKLGSESAFDKLGKSEMYSKLIELFSDVDPRLNRIKESVLKDLESLKGSSNLDSLASNMWGRAEKGLKKDLLELGVDERRAPELIAIARAEWDKAIQPVQMKEILESPEKSALDAYITNLENLPVISEMISSAEQSTEKKKNWEISLMGLKGKIPGVSLIAAPFLTQMGFDKNDPQTKKILSLLEEKPAKAEGKAGTAEGKSATPEEQEQVAENLTEDEKAVLKPLEDAGISMDPNRTKEDMAFLTEQGLDTNDKKIELTQNAVSTTGNTKKIFEAIKTHMTEPEAKKIGFRLRDIWQFEKELTSENVATIVEKITSVGKEPQKMRNFLTAARDLKTKTDAIENMANFA